MNTRALLITSLIAGILMAILSSLPVLYYGNCLACMWVWLSGIFAAWLYRRTTGSVLLSEGVVAGLISGIIGAILGAILEIVFGVIGIAALLGFMQSTTEEILGGTFTFMSISTIFSVLKLCFSAFFYPFFGGIGGAIGALIFTQKPLARQGS